VRSIVSPVAVVRVLWIWGTLSLTRAPGFLCFSRANEAGVAEEDEDSLVNEKIESSSRIDDIVKVPPLLAFDPATADAFFSTESRAENSAPPFSSPIPIVLLPRVS
jgi:hypothetical protein